MTRREKLEKKRRPTRFDMSRLWQYVCETDSRMRTRTPGSRQMKGGER